MTSRQGLYDTTTLNYAIAAKVGIPPFVKGGTIGPERTLKLGARAAMQLHLTGHSCIAQQFRLWKVGSADKVSFRFICTNVCYLCS